MTRPSTDAAVYQGVLFLFVGIPVYVWLRGRGERTGAPA